MAGGIHLPASTAGSRTGMIALAVGLTLLALLAQATLAARVRFFDACPNLLLVIVVSWSLLRGVTSALPLGFAAGLGFDLLAGLPTGTSSLGLMAASLLGGLGANRVFSANLALPVLLVAAATPVYAAVTLLTLQLTRDLPVDWFGVGLRVISPEMALNAALALVVYPIMRRLMGITQ
jgi:rod shape-determining protein MreD